MKKQKRTYTMLVYDHGGHYEIIYTTSIKDVLKKTIQCGRYARIYFNGELIGYAQKTSRDYELESSEFTSINGAFKDMTLIEDYVGQYKDRCSLFMYKPIKGRLVKVKRNRAPKGYLRHN